jgi:cellulose synthase/poly-beta-1,6-N-acetylglucosamine synthase-like glycosyltransferase
MKPQVSVIIPAYNTEKTISKTLQAVLSQDFPKNQFEVLVVDDGSTDNTKKIVSKFKRVKLISIRHSGPAKARNTGAKLAKGEIIVFTDSDCIPKKNWLKSLVLPFKDKDIVCVAGSYATLNKNKLIARFIGFEIEYRHQKMKKFKTIDFVGSYNCAYKKFIFKKFHGFDESFIVASGEDTELSYRIKDAGYKVIFKPKAMVFHPHPDNLLTYIKQKYNRAFWKVLLYKKHPKKMFGDRYTPRTLFPQILLSGLGILSLILSVFSAIFVYLFGLLIILSLLLDVEFYTFLWKKDKSLFFLSPLIIFLRNCFSLVAIFHGGFFFLIKKI